jgi:hypothetical protein
MEESIFKDSLIKDESESSILKSEGIVVYKQDRAERKLIAP